MLEELKDGQIEVMSAIDSACELDADGDITGVVQRGHHAPWRIREAALEYTGDEDPGWPRRQYMRSMPYSLLYPDEPPCDRGPEAILWMRCKRTDAGAIPVTLLDLP
mgnify:CR=1 FL=1